VKSLDPARFSFYTGRRPEDLGRVLENMEPALRQGHRVVETVLIPGFNEAEDVEGPSRPMWRPAWARRRQ